MKRLYLIFICLKFTNPLAGKICLLHKANQLVQLLMIYSLVACGGAGDETSINHPPTTNINSNASSVNVNTTIIFDSSESFDQDVGDTLSYDWRFGDGRSSQEANPSHVYDTAGSYIVSLVVTDNGGLTSSEANINITVNEANHENSAPIASFIVTPDTINVNSTVTFDSSASYDLDAGDTLAYD